MKRCSGVLLPIFSLAGSYGAGTLHDAVSFLYMLGEAGQSVWQLLPLGPVKSSLSPYQSSSAFAGNPLFISPEYLFERELLTTDELKDARLPLTDKIDYSSVISRRIELLNIAFLRNKTLGSVKYELSQRNLSYCFFAALRSHFGLPLTEWEDGIKHKEPRALAFYREKLASAIRLREFMQACFFDEWSIFKRKADALNIMLLGDVPMYTGADSADVWECPQNFLLNDSLAPKVTAGVPPDCFSPYGQNWKNPVYNYPLMKKNGFSWWRERIVHEFSLYSALRVDHFRGFYEYYAIPAGADASSGSWYKGAGRDLVDAVRYSAKGAVIAEDLGGENEQGVKELLEYSGFLGMRVLQFAFGSDENNRNLPHMCPENCAAYTGTHDNDTLKGWFEKAPSGEKEFAKNYLGITDKNTEDAFIDALMASRAVLAVVPVQDWLGLGSEARMNIPGTEGGNWLWRMTSPLPSQRMMNITQMNGRS